MSELASEPTILHVDLDAFFASVEVLQDPSLRGKPVIVGGAGRRGVVASCSYEARAYGIRSAMPSARAQGLCPHAVFVPGHYDLYAQYSRRMHAIFQSYTPLVEGISLDEAFLDVAGARRLFGPAPRIAVELREQIAAELSLTASVGVATSKLLAKLASEAAKPTASLQGPIPGKGVFVVEPDRELEFLHRLPVEALWGVGPATLARLERFGVRTVGELAAVPLATLVASLGQAAGNHLHELSSGRDDRAVTPERPLKSVSHEETYAHDHRDVEVLKREAVRLSDAVASRLRHAKVAARTVSVKVRFSDFRTITRSRTLPEPVTSGPAVARIACALLDEVDPSAGVRLLGVTATNLVEEAVHQLSLDDTTGAGAWDDATVAVDRIRERFGEEAVGPASAAGRPKRKGQQQWGPPT